MMASTLKCAACIVVISLAFSCTAGDDTDHNATTTVRCLDGWFRSQDQCYLIKGGDESLDSARQICSDHGATLASVQTNDELVFLYNQVHRECQDKNTTAECRQFADEGGCFTDYVDAQKNCRFSCGFCLSFCRDKTPGPCHYSVAQRGCQKIQKTKQPNCIQSCGCNGFNDDLWIQTPQDPNKTQENPFCGQIDITQSRKDSLVTMNCASTEKAGFICQKQTQALQSYAKDSSRNGCPVNSVPFRNTCFVLNEIPRTFKKAKEDCKIYSGVLAHVPNSAVFQKLKDRINLEKTTAWLGLTKNNENEYTWVKDEKVTYLPWGPKHTGSETVTCAVINTGSGAAFLEATDCVESHMSLCEIPREGDQGTVMDDPSPSDSGQDLKDCERPWDGHAEFCYKLFEDPLTWNEAQEICKTYQGNLVSQHGVSSINYLFNNFLKKSKPPLNAWIGLRKPSADEAFQWSDGSAFDFSHWHNQQNVTLTEERCIEANEGFTAWIDESCSKTRPYVCQVYKGDIIDIAKATNKTVKDPAAVKDTQTTSNTGFQTTSAQDPAITTTPETAGKKQEATTGKADLTTPKEKSPVLTTPPSSDSSKKPLSPTEPPQGSSTKPLSPTEPPQGSSKKPLSPTEPPQYSSKKPLSPTEPPQGSSKKPLSPTEPPQETSKKPLSPTDPPQYSSKQPPHSDSSKQPLSGSTNHAPLSGSVATDTPQSSRYTHGAGGHSSPMSTSNPRPATEPVLPTKAGEKRASEAKPSQDMTTEPTAINSDVKPQKGNNNSLRSTYIIIIAVSVTSAVIISALIIVIIFRRRRRIRCSTQLGIMLNDKSGARLSSTQGNRLNIWDYDDTPSPNINQSNPSFRLEDPDSTQDRPPSGLGDSATLEVSAPHLSSFRGL